MTADNAIIVKEMTAENANAQLALWLLELFCCGAELHYCGLLEIS